LSEEINDELTRATLHSALYVADEFRNQQAVLIPQISRVFLSEYEDLLSTDQSDFLEHQLLEGNKGTIKFTSWLLKNFILSGSVFTISLELSHSERVVIY